MARIPFVPRGVQTIVWCLISAGTLCAALGAASYGMPSPATGDAPWTLLTQDDGGFPEPSLLYYRVAMEMSQLGQGMKIGLRISCPKARAFAVNVYDQESGAFLAVATDREITGQTDISQPSACEPGQVFDLALVRESSRTGGRELVIPAQSDRSIEIWFRAYLGKSVEPPKISLLTKEGHDAGAPATIPVYEFPTWVSIPDAARRQKNLPPAPDGDRMRIMPTRGSWIFPNGYSYLISRLDDDVSLPGNKRRFSKGGIFGRGAEQFALLKFKPPTTSGAGQVAQARYWSVCLVDAPSTQLLWNTDGTAACVNDESAKLSSDGTVSIILGSPKVVKFARSQGVNALPVTYPRPVVAMPLMMYRVVPNDPNFKGAIPRDRTWPGTVMSEEELSAAMGDYAPKGRYFSVSRLEDVVQSISGVNISRAHASSEERRVLPRERIQITLQRALDSAQALAPGLPAPESAQ